MGEIKEKVLDTWEKIQFSDFIFLVVTTAIVIVSLNVANIIYLQKAGEHDYEQYVRVKGTIVEAKQYGQFSYRTVIDINGKRTSTANIVVTKQCMPIVGKTVDVKILGKRRPSEDEYILRNVKVIEVLGEYGKIYSYDDAWKDFKEAADKGIDVAFSIISKVVAKTQ